MVFRGTPQPIPQSVAEALRVAADHMEESGDERSRLLRELSNGFASKGRRTDQWEVTVAKYHTGMATQLFNSIVRTVISGLAEEVLARLDQPLTQWFVRRDTGTTRRSKTDYVYQCEISSTTDHRPPLTNLVHQMGEAAWGEFLDDTLAAEFKAVIPRVLKCTYVAKRSHPTEVERLLNRYSGSYYYTANCYWQLKLPQQPVVEHFGYSMRDL